MKSEIENVKAEVNDILATETLPDEYEYKFFFDDEGDESLIKDGWEKVGGQKMKILSNGPDTDITITEEYKLISNDGNIMRYDNGYWIKCEDFLQYSRYPDKFIWDICPVTKQGKLVMMPTELVKSLNRKEIDDERSRVYNRELQTRTKNNSEPGDT